jgi:hypothetical protein
MIPGMMIRTLILIGLALVPVLAWSVQDFNGQTEGGAFYSIAAPDDWVPADGLVIYNHGFDIGSIDPDPDLGVLSGFVLSQGYAVAASSYRLNGWALFNTAQDNQALYQRVVALLGEPEHVIVFGGSLGALVTVQAVEQGGIGNVVGAYPVCGPLLGSDIWHQALDLRLSYDLICEGVSGGELPGGAEGLPFTLDPADFDGVLGDLTSAAIGAAVNNCTGLGLPPILRSDGQQQRLDRLVAVSGIVEEFLFLNMAYATAVLSDLVHDPAKLNGANALGNSLVDYGDAEINQNILRVTRDPFDHLTFKRSYTPTGQVGNTRVLITHTDKDDLVFVENQSVYLQRIPSSQVSAAVVIDDAAGHCAYTPAELVSGFEALVEWIDSDEKPDPQGLQDRCQGIVDSQRFSGPCRYDPNYQIADIDTRIRPRNVPEDPVSGKMNGSFFVQEKSGQGWFVEILEDQRAVVYWFTYDPEGRPIWIGGTGKVLDNAIMVDESWTTSGALFGADFDPQAVVLSTWGSLEFLFTADRQGLMRYAGPAEFGTDRESIVQLTRVGDPACITTGFSHSGIWYDPDRNGEGIILEVQTDGRVFAAWFTYDLEGNQLWLYGEADSVLDNQVQIALSRFQGPAFGANFDSAELVGQPWGRLTMDVLDADRLAARYDSTQEGFGSGEIDLVRLTRPVTESNCSSLVE